MKTDSQQNTLDREQVRQHFSAHAAEYNRYAQVQQRVVRRLVNLLAASSANFQTGLEVGCGTGALSRIFYENFPSSSLILSDLAHGMSLQSLNALPGSAVCDADASALPFMAQSFDFLISSSVYQWVERLPAAFQEAGRVLKSDGMFGLALFGERTLHELRTSHQRALPEHQSHGQSFPTLEAVNLALQGRFDVEQLFSEDELEWHADVPDLLRGLKRIGAQNSSTRRPPGLASRRVMQAMFDHYRAEFGDTRGIPATYQVIYLLARKKPELSW
ncbi:MAG TPA: malonyl-ACP O-methyltransferase BioC [Geopsychrobacteraceae bacterium]|nr:malonyl-ACP O-methyltransferase BioC [Geopsychrobacteraceae bacterium]